MKKKSIDFALECKEIDWLGDGFCDDDTNTPECNFDNGDCCGCNVNTDYCATCQCKKGGGELCETTSTTTTTKRPTTTSTKTTSTTQTSDIEGKIFDDFND